MAQSILKTQNLSIGYQQKKQRQAIVSHLDIAVKKGELVAVLGVNGVGKSTLLRTISGIQPALEGEIFIASEEIKTLSPVKMAQLVGLVLTNQPISKNLSIIELVALGRHPYTNWIGKLTPADKEQIKKALQAVEIEDLQHKKCYQLSDGQLQKALIARALAQNTPMIVLDEPTSHLDMYHKAQVLKLLKTLTRKTQKAIVFATHEINLALQLCDKIVLLQKTGGIHMGTPQELVNKEVFQKIFPSDLIVFDAASKSFKIKD